MKEGEFLLKLLRDDVAPCSPALLDEGVLRQTALNHGILPLVKSSLGEDTPETIRTRVRELAVRAIEYSSEVELLADHFARSGIPVLFFKGIPLSYTIYDAPEHRTTNDIDILVRPIDLEKAELVLRTLDYELPDSYSAQQRGFELKFSDAREYRNTRNYIAVDLHWRLLKVFYGISFPIEDLFHRSMQVRVGHKTISTLSPEDHLLFLCIHGGKHAWNELKWIVDIAMLLRTYPSLHFTGVENRASQLRARRMLHLGLALAQRLAGASLPQNIAVEISEDSVVQKLSREIRTRLVNDIEPDIRQTVLSDLAMRENVADKLLYLFRRALTPHAEDWKHLRLPDSLLWLHYLIRPFRLTYRYARK